MVDFAERRPLIRETTEKPSARIETARGSGVPLPEHLRVNLERRLGVDLSAVRIHTDARADALAGSLGADAFTSGNDVFLRDGRHDRGGSAGQDLIAHEASHVAQQMRGTTGRTGGISDPADPAEAEARRFARGHLDRSASASDEPPPVVALPVRPMVIQRQEAAAATLDYDAFSLPSGEMSDGAAADRLTRDPRQLDQLYADAEAGNARARRFVQDLESVYARAGEAIAEREYSVLCQLPVVHELGHCIPDWSYLNYLSADRPGGSRLRFVIGEQYALRSRVLGVRNEIIGHALNLLYAGSVARRALLVPPPPEPVITPRGTPPPPVVTSTGVPPPPAKTTTSVPRPTTAVTTSTGGQPSPVTTTSSLPSATPAPRPPSAAASPGTIRPAAAAAGPAAAEAAAPAAAEAAAPAAAAGGFRLGRVVYGEGTMSRLAQRMRLKLGLRRGGNVAVFEFDNLPEGFQRMLRRLGGDNVLIDGNRVAFQNVSGAAHSEQLGHELVVAGRRSGYSLAVRRIYTEYNPCTQKCLKLIRGNYPGVPVDYSFVWEWWGNETPYRNAAVEALFERP